MIGNYERPVLVLGATGMAGHLIAQFLHERGRRVIAASREEPGVGFSSEWVRCDLSNVEEVHGVLRQHDYAAVINAVGLLVADSEARPHRAIYLNSLLPHLLAQALAGQPAKLIHLSTDCVFSGASGPYCETDFRDGESVYDRSKALGELQAGEGLTLRMSIIGPECRAGGTGLLHWFLGQTGRVPGYQGVEWNGITTLELASAIDQLIGATISGLYHLVPDYSISKYELLELVRQVFRRGDVEVLPEALPTSNKVLVDTRRELPFVVGAGGYLEQLTRMNAWILRHENMYGPRYREGLVEEVGP